MVDRKRAAQQLRLPRVFSKPWNTRLHSTRIQNLLPCPTRVAPLKPVAFVKTQAAAVQSRGRRPCAVLSHDADNEAEDPHRRTVDQTGTQVLRQCLQSTGHNVGCCLCLLRSHRQLTYILSEERRCSLLWTQHLLRHLYIVYEGLPGGPSAQPAYEFPAKKQTTSEVRGKTCSLRNTAETAERICLPESSPSSLFHRRAATSGNW